jgi:hypothetical protein
VAVAVETGTQFQILTNQQQVVQALSFLVIHHQQQLQSALDLQDQQQRLDQTMLQQLRLVLEM